MTSGRKVPSGICTDLLKHLGSVFIWGDGRLHVGLNDGIRLA
jgi:hypothetical protein